MEIILKSTIFSISIGLFQHHGTIYLNFCSRWR